MPLDVAQLRTEAESGSVPAQAALGICLLLGHGVAQDYAEALLWLSLCDQLGVPRARWNLGVMYLLGLGVTRDPQRAKLLFEKAAHGGELGAAIELARLAYASGQLKEAAQWYTHVLDGFSPSERAAHQEDPILIEAREFLGVCKTALQEA